MVSIARLFCFSTACCIFTAAALCVSAEKLVLYVSPSGNDKWSGTIPTALANRTDGPLASLEGAKMAVRKIRANAHKDAVQVVFESGRYQISSPVIFGSEDSGYADGPVIYQAANGAEPVISGGVRIQGFKVRKDGLWEASIPTVASGKWYFEQLWVNGKRATRARTPNRGFLAMEKLVNDYTDPATSEKVDISRSGFVAKPEDIAPLLQLSSDELKDVQITTYSSWETARHHIHSLDSGKNIIRLASSALWEFPMGNVNAPRYHIENLRSALDAPGEWFLGRDGVLLYKPLKGETPEKSVVFAPIADSFIQLDGDPAEKRAVENIQFRGLTFEHSQYLLPKDGYADGQAEVGINAVITAHNAKNIVFADCVIRHIGEYGIWFRDGSRDCKVSRCLMQDLGAGGVKIGEFAYTDNDDMLVKHITVDNNIIRGCGKVQTAGIGVLIGHSPDNQITHNEISDLYYTAISVGWSWGYGNSNAKNNKIEYNHLHHIGYGVLSDMGAVYTLGVSPGTTVNNNVVHDVTAHSYGGWGLYNDEGSTGIVLENNLIYNCNCGGYHQHYGQENHFTNNIIAYCGPAQVIRTRLEDHISFIFDHNILIFDSQPYGGNIPGNLKIDNNLYYNSAGINFKFAGKTFDEWKALGYDQNSIIADPMFRNPAKIDFRLKPGSPASKIGFQPFDYNKAGVYGDPAWKRMARDYTYQVPFKTAEQKIAQSYNIDFENMVVNAKLNKIFSTNITYAGDDVFVTDETASTGTKCLKFVDKPGLSQSFYPYIDARILLEDGVVVDSFDVRVENGADFWHEWRDWTVTPYLVGPLVRIKEGKLIAGDKELMDIPLGTWANITISCGLGTKATGTWTLKVKLPGKSEQVFKGIRLQALDFKLLSWIGFVSNGVTDGVMYIDNLKLNRN